ncbi:MAG: hypothetical protein WAK20_07800, partial [Candidatus Acidiferrum sp.]
MMPPEDLSRTKLHKVIRFLGIVLLFIMVSIHMLAAAGLSTPVLQLAKTIVLSGVPGKFDHFAIDLPGNRLFAASGGKHSVEVIDLKTDKVQQSITGLGKPHGLAWVPATGSLYVSDGALAELRVYKGEPLVLAGTIKLSDD